jgi:hypothetical protein
MQLWTPPRDEPELLAWWAPLLLVARLAREDRVPWPIHIDQFDVLGRVDRGGARPPVWVYRHHTSGRDIYADPSGQSYRFRPTPNAAGPGRFDRCDVRTCVYLAGLPEVVEPNVEDHDGGSRFGWSDAAREDGMAAHPTAQQRATQHHARCRPMGSRVAREDRWLHAVPAMPA